jgi:arylsulfatase A-like enzyme
MLLDRLARDGRLDDTLVILVSDHGEEFYEHGRFGHYRTLFEEVVHVPLVIRWPAHFSPSRTRELVSLTDVAPTILELCDLPQKGTMWGRSLAQLGKRGQPLPPRAAPLEVTFGKPENFLRGLHGGDHKVVQHSKASAATYYDLGADPGEQQPIAEPDADAQIARRIAAVRAVWDELARLASSMARSVDNELPSDVKKMGLQEFVWVPRGICVLALRPSVAPKGRAELGRRQV